MQQGIKGVQIGKWDNWSMWFSVCGSDKVEQIPVVAAKKPQIHAIQGCCSCMVEWEEGNPFGYDWLILMPYKTLFLFSLIYRDEKYNR